MPIGAPLAEGIVNTGSFSWTPSADLEADTTHYGIQLIDDVDGHYQYSPQFGISKDLCDVKVSSSAVVYPTAEPSSTDVVYPTASVTASVHGGYGQSSVVVVSTSVYISSVTAVTPVGTGYPIANSTLLQPTKSLSVPASLQTTASGGLPTTTGSAAPEFTGAASNIRAGLGLAGAVAGLVFML